MASYIALMRKEKKSDYSVDFPDFPGCVSAGKTMEEARWMAQEAIEGHVEVMREHGEEIPEPSALERIMADPENADALVIAFLITLPPAKSKAVRINITMQESLLEKVDSYVREHKNVKNRSVFLSKVAEEYMVRKKPKTPAAGKKRAKAGRSKTRRAVR